MNILIFKSGLAESASVIVKLLSVTNANGTLHCFLSALNRVSFEQVSNRHKAAIQINNNL